jgi:hypothetical protein
MKDFKLDNLPKIAPGFKTPDHYFEDFSKKMMQKLLQEEPKVILLHAKRKKWIMAAAALLIITLMLPVYNNINQPSDQLDTASIENYIDYQSNISQYDIVNLLDKQDVESIDLDIQLEDKTIEDVLTNNNNLENYIPY